MLSQPLNVFLALCLLTLSYCSAMRQITPIGRSPSVRQENSITEATCFTRSYDSLKLNQAAADAKTLLDNMERLSEDKYKITYTPGTEEKMLFRPPYFLYPLYEDKTDDYTADFVVVTQDGRVAKVVTKVRWTFRLFDCQMTYAQSSNS